MNVRTVLAVIALAMLWAGALAAGDSEYSAWFEKAQELTLNGSIREANLTYENVLMLCDESLARNPDDAQVWHERGLALAYLGGKVAADESFIKSIDILNRTIESNPASAEDALMLMALNYELLGMPEAAIRTYDKVTETNFSTAVDAWIRKSDLLFRYGAYNESAEAFDKAAKLMPDKPVRMNASWDEENVTISLDFWAAKDNIYKVLIGSYNKTSHEYDRYSSIVSNKANALAPIVIGVYPFDTKQEKAGGGYRARQCCGCYVPATGTTFWSCSNMGCPRVSCRYTKLGCCA